MNIPHFLLFPELVLEHLQGLLTTITLGSGAVLEDLTLTLADLLDVDVVLAHVWLI